MGETGKGEIIMEELTLEKLMDLVVDMRTKQAVYFRNRNASALDAAKAAERLVDMVIKEEKGRTMPQQKRMFE